MTISRGESPLVSIGMPVYNGERYVRQAVESLLAQDYGNFELIIADNASQDSTLAICREYQCQDKRIRLYKHDYNLGIAKNFNIVFHLSSGKYFMWAGHDDLWEKSYLRKCVAKLEENPTAVLCISEVQLIDESGNIRGSQCGERKDGRETVGMDVAKRVHTLMAQMFWYEIYGVIRPEYLRKTRLFQDKYGCDLILLMELLLLGEFVKVPEKLFVYRRHQPEDTTEKRAAMEPAKALKESFASLAKDLWEVIRQADLADSVKEAIGKELFHCLSFENVVWRSIMLNENKSILPSAVNIQDIP